MTGAPIEVRPTIDRAWLERVASLDPIDHAFALWDLDRNPGRIRFFSAVEGGTTIGYLLVWLGHPAAPVVHWFGEGPWVRSLVGILPPRPCVAIVPTSVAPTVEAVRGPGRRSPLLVLARDPRMPLRFTEGTPAVRPLLREDLPRLSTWSRQQNDPVAAEYPFLDPEVERAWGAFDGERLVGVVRAEVRLPRVWVLGGVYVEPTARGRGWGRVLLGAAVSAAEGSGAQVALYVREDRTAARSLYESVGFRTVGHRVWLDLGAGLLP
ncbi:MAG: GNAT family N-acetyltransferase [Thermoplasmata archaeon]